jgi:hypothetical protein
MVLSHKDNKIYFCAARWFTEPPRQFFTLKCAGGEWKGTLLKGPAVKTVVLELPFPQTRYGLEDTFWQLDQATGDIQYCSAIPFYQGASNCVRAKIP